MKVGDWAFLILFLLVLGLVLFFAISSAVENSKRRKHCDEICEPFTSRIIESECHCMDIEHRWVKAPESEE